MIVAFVAASVAYDAEASAGCFKAGDNRRLAYEFIKQAPSPRVNGEPGYFLYLLTGAAIMQESSIAASQSAGIERYRLHWANRSTACVADKAGRVLPRKPNIRLRDYEVADNRTSEQITIFGWLRIRQGDIDANYDGQMNTSGLGDFANLKRLLINFELADTTTKDARQARDFVAKGRLAGAIFDAMEHGKAVRATSLPIARLAFLRLESVASIRTAFAVFAGRLVKPRVLKA